MDSEIKELIEKHLKKCPECGKTFLAIMKRAYYTYEHLKYCSSNIEKYPLLCGKCPNCAWNCYNNVDKIIEFVKKNNRMPCSHKWTIFDYFSEENREKSFGDDKIKEYVKAYFEDWELYEDEMDFCHPIFKDSDGLDPISDLELIDLLDFFKEE